MGSSLSGHWHSLPDVARQSHQQFMPLINAGCGPVIECPQLLVNPAYCRVLSDRDDLSDTAGQVILAFAVLIFLRVKEVVAGYNIDRLFKQRQVAQLVLAIVVAGIWVSGHKC